MFAPDIVSLRQFYSNPFGEAVRALLAESIHRHWPGVAGDAMLAIGYATPYLAPYIDQAKPLLVCMPAGQGAEYWPAARANMVFLGSESELPLQDNSVNRVLLLHSVENTEQLSWMMQEIWRVLTPEGRVLAVVPNRLSLWSRLSRSPFGYGRPFSMAQMRDLMSDHRFALTRCCSALFVPPLHSRLLWKLAQRIEKVGQWLGLSIGGVLLVEAEKQVHAAIQQPAVLQKNYRVRLQPATPFIVHH